ncbi:hypothetical protein BAE44_0016587 [Dichanthelium oligosanthes]|uniref:Uncharacterized protein n=1 Tax=Dichanthelium oligosanthes TaxID=888268 RepID=A0A1E5VB65_9POAL|nr:hypothetical protein BAE44_0016587 [Dichanthelium oligosanthes]
MPQPQPNANAAGPQAIASFKQAQELTRIVTKNYSQPALPTLVINEARDRLASVATTFRYEMGEF